MKQQSTIKKILTFARVCKGKMLCSVFCAIFSVIGGIVPFWSVYQIILSFFIGSSTIREILFWVMVCAVGSLIKVVFYGISLSLSHKAAYRILENIRLTIADKLMAAPLGATLQKTAGSLKNSMVDRVETMELPLAHLIPEGISNLLLPIGVAIYLVVIDWRMALAAFLCVPLGIIAYAFVMKTFQKQYEAQAEASTHANSVIVEYIEGIEVIKMFGRSGSSYEKFTKAIYGVRDFALAWFYSTQKWMSLAGAILPSTLLGILPIGIFLYTQGTLSPAVLTMSMILSMGIIGPVAWFPTVVNSYKEIEYALGDVEELLHLPNMPDAVEAVGVQGYDVCFEEVSFAYDKDTAHVLRDINLTLPQGSFTALVGPSGSGKSTIARLLARFWDVSEGKISIGGTDIREIPLSQLAHMVSFVTQDNFLFDCSLLENIRLGKPEAKDEEVFAAAKAAECEIFINKLEHGWQTTAGAAGGKLSGGERQRIAIARAILKNAPIVILDEATAFTDAENEDKLQRSLERLTKGKTLLVIAHRLYTIQNADQIVLLQKGTVVEVGTQTTLLKGNSLYRSLWEAHVGASTWRVGQT